MIENIQIGIWVYDMDFGISNLFVIIQGTAKIEKWNNVYISDLIAFKNKKHGMIFPYLQIK